MKSYVHGKGSYSESHSKPSLSEVLSLIPDNSNKQVSPRDLRDAMFSIWEGSPIKFTYYKSLPYIGLDRPETKLKMFLGKKDLRGHAVMSIDLINSDVDIFLYNNKLDESEYQDFKMSILAGVDPSIWKLAPTIEVKSRDKNLDLSINNENGEINFNSNHHISMNNIKWPSKESINKMIVNPSKIEKGDLGVFLVDGKFIEFKASNITEEITFTDDTPTQVDIGGIEAGSTFNNIPISELIRQILYPYLTPKIVIEFIGIGSNNSVERDHTNDSIIEMKISLVRRSKDLESSLMKLSNTKTTFSTKECEVFSSSGPSKFEYYDFINISPNRISIDKTNGELSVSMDVKDVDGKVGSTSEKLNFVYPYFYGFGDKIQLDPDTSSRIFGLINKKIDIKFNQSIPVIGSGYFYFAYPKMYGKLLSFNGDDIDKSFELSQIKNIYSIDGKWGSVEYNIYVSKKEISIHGIPEIWKFRFD